MRRFEYNGENYVDFHVNLGETARADGVFKNLSISIVQCLRSCI